MGTQSLFVDELLIRRAIDYLITNVIMISLMAYNLHHKLFIYLIFIVLAVIGSMIHENTPRVSKCFLIYNKELHNKNKTQNLYVRKVFDMSVRVLVKYLPLSIIAILGNKVSLLTYAVLFVAFVFINFIWKLATEGDLLHDTLASTHVILSKDEKLYNQPKPKYKSKNKQESNDKDLVAKIDFKKVKSILDKENVRNPDDYIIKVKRTKMEKKKKNKSKNKKKKDTDNQSTTDTKTQLTNEVDKKLSSD